MSDLNELRQKIDSLDKQIINLLNERAGVVVDVGAFKRNVDGAPPIYAPDRERAVLDRIKRINNGPLPDRCLIAVYRELMSGSFFLERPLRIAFLGPEGSFSHSAAKLKFGKCVEYEPQVDIRGVFDEVAREHCDLGIVPVENTIAGGIIETLDLLIDSSVSICAEVPLAIHHNLLANCPMEDVKKIYSKPEVFNQCRNWLSSAMSNIETIQAASTARAAIRVADEANSAAIGSRLAAELYGLQIVCENVEDNPNNVTRFFVISRDCARKTGNDKTTFIFSVSDKAGALVDVLQSFRSNGVNLTNIESRPSRKREGVYNFFADCLGHLDDENMKQAIKDVRSHCLQLCELGSYPCATEVL